MWEDMGYKLPLQEGKFWLENNFIQAFTSDGEMHKLYKYKVFKHLSIEITPYVGNKKTDFNETKILLFCIRTFLVNVV